MKKIGTLSLVALLGLSVALTGCGKEPSSAAKAKDGTYQGMYQDDSKNPSKIVVNLTIAGGKITACESVETDAKGQPKDENYGREAGADKFAIAQKAVAGAKTYPKTLVEKQDLEQMDAVSGATTSFKMFKAAVQDALEKAK